MKALPIAVLLAVAAVAPAAARTAPALRLRASTKHVGRIDLRLTGPAGAQVDVSDVTGARRKLGHVTLDAGGAATFPRAGTWSCANRERTFYAEGTDASGAAIAASTKTTTPSCAHRYTIRVTPRRPRAGRRITVRIADAFRLAHQRVRVCARGPVRLRVCGQARVDPRGSVRLTLPRMGRWRISTHLGDLARSLTVHRAPGPLRLLATGDSMIQLVDSFLGEQLSSRQVGVHSDAHISTGLSKPSLLNWPRHARHQVAKLRPDVTVMFIGANDSFPFGSVACCGEAWRKHYADVASAMMRTYERGGAGTVFWCLLPAPRDASFRRPFIAVNAALHRAAARHRGTVHLVDLGRTFTPGYRFRKSIVWDGRKQRVRQDDGVHLNLAGASIAATLIVRRLGRAGVL